LEHALNNLLQHNKFILGNSKTSFESEKLQTTLYNSRFLAENKGSFDEFSKQLNHIFKTSLNSTDSLNIQNGMRQMVSPRVTYVETNK